MTDVKVEQCDVDRARQFISDEWPSWDADSQTVSAALIVDFARHRQAAEKAQQERDAGISDAHRQARLEAAKNAHARKAKPEAGYQGAKHDLNLTAETALELFKGAAAAAVAKSYSADVAAQLRTEALEWWRIHQALRAVATHEFKKQHGMLSHPQLDW